MRQKHFEKNLLGKMLIEQIIKYELRGPVLLGRICTAVFGYFYEKAKISEENL